MHNLALRTNAGRRLLPSSKSTTCHCRSVSTSPYGRAHVWKRRLPVLPNPVIPKYPQTIIRSDGTSFIQWTTSPKSLIRLTRDTTNNPVWNTEMWVSDVRGGLEEEIGSTGRMGRFNRKFGSGVGNVVGGSATTTTATSSSVQSEMKEVKVEKTVGEGEETKETKAGVKTKVREDVIDLTGMDMGMGMGMDMSMGMGGSLDDVKWYEDMAKLTGGEPSPPVKAKKEKDTGEKKEKKEKKGRK